MALSTRLLTLRKSPVLLKLPPYLSLLCILVGVAWLLLLPLNDYSRQTYVSENAILPGQVHTYFGGSEHNIFRAYRQEAYRLSFENDQDRDAGLEKVLKEIGLKTAQQPYRYTVAGEDIQGTNVYGLLQGPRADATEAMVLMAAWKNFEGETNWSGVALALTLARYFKRWSIWSKDILVLFPAESVYGSEAWVSAYHSVSTEATSLRNVSALPIKAGALQGAVALDYPVGPWGHRFDKIDIQYDGINGALPNLDLLNTAVSVASGQMHIGCTLHGMAKHSDSYRDRLETLGKGLVTQAAGHATGPHSPFMPYHVDAITLKAVGDGWHDEMSLGRTTESLFRSINNLLEHLHQSFFFYILLNANRFVSIGNYLPAAMLIAGSFTITALGLWVESGRVPPPKKDVKPASTDKKKKGVDMKVVREGGDVALVPVTEERVAEREVSLPSLLVLGAHLVGFVPLYLLNTLAKEYLPIALHATTLLSLLLPYGAAKTLVQRGLTKQQVQITQSFSLLLLGATLSTLATLNFSLAFVVGLISAGLCFVRTRPRPAHPTANIAVGTLTALAHSITSPPVVIYILNWYLAKGKGWYDVSWLLYEMAQGWVAQDVYTSFVIWAIWWPAWVSAGDEVAVGDAIAQTSLAEILLRFNTGIVQIISCFLERDNGDIVHLDYRSLTDLSDLSRLETCRILQQLCVRLSQRGSRPLPDSRRAARDEISRRDNGSKISGHSVARVVIQGSSKPPQLMFVKPAERGRKPKPLRTHSAPNYELSGISKADDTPPSSPPPYELYDTHARSSRPREQHRPPQKHPKLRKSRSKPSRDDMETYPSRADQSQLSATKSMPDLHKSKSRHLKSPTSSQTDLPPPMPRPRTSHKHLKSPTGSQTHLPPPTPRPRTSTKNLKPLSSSQTHLPPPSSSSPRPRNDRIRALRDPVPTYYSQLSDQTKLGEIPLERWPEAFDFEGMETANREALARGWPLNRWEGQTEMEGKRRRGFWGLFRRKGG
ncbi:Glycosylphosphatidylinositol:protein transamidase, GAA1 component [Hortaea werneckii]|nr:Glycosylphosphatidylinositol:protein transamidase, GAA1 component [Hortaea werneckii]KAI7098658.1 Glycosylphosphatidylinositol:protein transamidase, GAA1 component [Hortaea werneckii]KAI7240710.1 Glycosylphosphatidylinositol:protein transamidase, GAA1 component [Hortaea werneckii]KAI7324628.1 Glycosylphosphatidylinositol:protein transamidase, GAA1 component [Hortaea werneckii]KAI7404084.1 Glycosylphosphatidylinositol:protein transamidase, GAA1 component [Hortaea werneckii]